MAKFLYYDASAGISGDMNLAALVELGVDFGYLCAELEKLNLSGEFKLERKSVLKNGIVATKIDVVPLKSQPHARSYADIRQILESSNLSRSCKQRAGAIFRTVAEAEAKVHGTDVERVHFHEVGAIDSIADVAGAAICFEYLFEKLGVSRVVSSKIELGGGVAVEKAAKSGRERFKFTVPLLGDARTAYSFSGLKNQVRVETEKLAKSRNLGTQDVADICFAFENTACKHILNKLEKIFAQRKFERFGVVGGASANLNLRSRLQALCDKYGCELICAPLEFCSDNAAMIARAGREKYLRGEFAGLDLQASPRSELTRI